MELFDLVLQRLGPERNAMESITNSLKLGFQKLRIRHCDHCPPWNVLTVSDTIWWRAPISLEFYRGNVPPPKDKFSNCLFGFWTRARVFQCKKCKGIFDEILLGEKWLTKLEATNRRFLFPNEVDELKKQCCWSTNI